MKPNELASAIIKSSNTSLDFNSNNYYKLTIGWNDGVLEWGSISKVMFGDKKTEYHSTQSEKDLAGVEEPLIVSSSHGCKTLNYFIRPSHNIGVFHTKVIDGIRACIKVYEKQLKSELDQTLKSIALIKQQK